MTNDAPGAMLPNPLLGQRIREARGLKAWTQQQLAEALGSSSMQGDVSKWETGRARPSFATLTKIAEKTGAELSSFLSSSPDGYRDGLRSAARRLRRVLADIEAEIDDADGGPPMIPPSAFEEA
jgi:transcriptional regulator with XRE-family HTH domain